MAKTETTSNTKTNAEVKASTCNDNSKNKIYNGRTKERGVRLKAESSRQDEAGTKTKVVSLRRPRIRARPILRLRLRSGFWERAKIHKGLGYMKAHLQ